MARQQLCQTHLANLVGCGQTQELLGVKNCSKGCDSFTEDTDKDEDSTGPVAEHTVEEGEFDVLDIFWIRQRFCHDYSCLKLFDYESINYKNKDLAITNIKRNTNPI